MKSKIKQQQAARELRASGISISKIGKMLGVSKSSVSVWVSDIVLTDCQKKLISGKTTSEKFVCRGCGKEFDRKRITRRNVFCSFECYLVNSLRKKPHAVRRCLFCGKEIPCRGGVKFCSSKCGIEYDWKNKIDIAKKSGYAPAHQTMAKNLILKMRERKCEVCSGEQWMESPIPLILDHINGHSDDWRLENLRLVCGNCDMMLPTYKSKNRGNGRKYDREYRRKMVACDNGIRSALKADGPSGLGGSSPSATATGKMGEPG